MKIVEEYPPNYDTINQAFPLNKERKAIFCYGDTIYNPFKVHITPDLEHHESIHSKQQGDYPDVWWYRYINDKEFRLEQEIEAYGEQYKFAKENGVKGRLLNWAKEKMAEALSGELYGNLITYGQAESKIRNYAKDKN